MASPTQRTLQLLRKEGWTAAVVEHFNVHARVRQDLFGFADVVALHPGHAGVLAVQCTTTANQASRLAKLLLLPAVRLWLQCGNQLQVWGWKRSRRTGRWEVTRQPLTLAGLPEIAAATP
jgi:hypothetical protein